MGHVRRSAGELRRTAFAPCSTRRHLGIGSQMGRRKGELSAAGIDRGWPHQVVLPERFCERSKLVQSIQGSKLGRS
jgi:hypothetical protein